MRRAIILIVFLQLVVLFGCKKKEEELPNDISSFKYKKGAEIPIFKASVTGAEYQGNLHNFSLYKKENSEHPLFFLKSTLKYYQIIFEFDAIYPVDYIEIFSEQTKKYSNIENVEVSLSLDGYKYDRKITKKLDNNKVPLENNLVRKVKITFPSNNKTILNSVKLYLGSGLVVKERDDWSNKFLHYSNWSGADGIFSYNLDGPREMWAFYEDSLFIYSDTLVGETYEHNNLRKSFEMINNSISYYNQEQDSMLFEYEKDGEVATLFEPSFFIGNKKSNLLNGEGLIKAFSSGAKLTNNAESTMYLTTYEDNEIIIDFKEKENINELYIWNYNLDLAFNTKVIEVFDFKNDDWELIDEYQLIKSSGTSDDSYQNKLVFDDLFTNKLKVVLKEGYDSEYLGLGKLLFIDNKGNPLYPTTIDKAERNLSEADKTARLWLQDGIIIGNNFYTFPILVKDFEDLFKVHQVGLIEVPIKNKRLELNATSYFQTPLQAETLNREIIYFGAGVLDNRIRDGYIYIYGYKDGETRDLVVSRIKEEDILDFAKYQYYGEDGWSNDIQTVKPLIKKVSAELSVTYMPEGMFAGKYMLVVMENTLSGTISYSLSDSPVGEFMEYEKVYQTTIHNELKNVFSYNAKLHPHLSEKGRYLISYNVNASVISALSDVRSYYPRFIELIEIEGD